jgi:hypothetical protein
MRYYILFASISIPCLLLACGTDSTIVRASEICNRYPSPQARADCESRHKEEQAVFQKYQDEKYRKQRESGKDDATNANDLCFKRQSTGEIVCPN